MLRRKKSKGKMFLPSLGQLQEGGTPVRASPLASAAHEGVKAEGYLS